MIFISEMGNDGMGGHLFLRNSIHMILSVSLSQLPQGNKRVDSEDC